MTWHDEQCEIGHVLAQLQAPAIAARFGLGAGPTNRQVARTLHFLVLVWMVIFIAMHTIMVFATGLVGNLNHIIFGTDTNSLWALVIYLIAMAVIVLLAVGADYNLLLVSRFKEEIHAGLNTGIIRAMGGTGSVVLSPRSSPASERPWNVAGRSTPASASTVGATSISPTGWSSCCAASRGVTTGPPAAAPAAAGGGRRGAPAPAQASSATDLI